MKLLRPDPAAVYLSRDLWLPKSRVREEQVQRALTFLHPRDPTKFVRAFRHTPTHWLVPRNMYEPDMLQRIGPLHDLRRTEFPHVSLKSSVILDKREPDKTFQAESSAALLNTYDGILCLRCGGGKTAVGLHSAAQLNVPILVVVDDRGLAVQWREAIETYLGVTVVGQVGDGKFDWEHDITIATVQTLAKRAQDGTLPLEMLYHFGVLLIDEAHIMGAPFFNLAVPPFFGRRWALSATPTRGDSFDPLLRYTMGPIVYQYLKHVLRPKVVFRRLSTRLANTAEVYEATRDSTGELHNGKLYSYFATLTDRTNKIIADVNTAIGNGREVLVLTHSRAMCELLGDSFVSGGATHGGVRSNEHMDIVRNSNPLIAIMKRGKQALDKPSIDTIFVCEPFTNPNISQQVLGRMLRPVEGKQQPTLVIYEDVHIKELYKMCQRLRVQLARWPANQGGAIPTQTVKEV